MLYKYFILLLKSEYDKWYAEKVKLEKSFKRVVKKKNHNKCQDAIFYELSKYSVLTRIEKITCDDEWVNLDESEPPKKRGRPNRPSKQLGSLKSLKYMRKRTKPVFDSIVQECEKEQIDFGLFLAFMGRRYYSVFKYLVKI